MDYGGGVDFVFACGGGRRGKGSSSGPFFSVLFFPHSSYRGLGFLSVRTKKEIQKPNVTDLKTCDRTREGK